MRHLSLLVPLILAGCGEPLPNVPPPQPAPLPCPPDAPHCPRCPRCGAFHYPGEACQPTGQVNPPGGVLRNPGASIYEAKADSPAERPFVGKATIGGPVSPDGSESVTCDLPMQCRQRNKAGSNGAGCCVTASIRHAAHWQNVQPLKDYLNWASQYPGGHNPQKVDSQLSKLAPTVRYVHYLGNDLSAIRLALKTGRMPSTTYGGNHMVSTPHCSDRWAAVLDNNYIGEQEIRWFKPDEYQRLYAQGGGWTCILLDPRPPAPPRNLPRR